MSENMFEKLSNYWVVVKNGLLMPGYGRHPYGCITPYFESEDKANIAIQEFFSPEELKNTEIIRIDNPWNVMRRAAGEGLCGFSPIFQDCDAIYFDFKLRVEEAGSELPTVLTVLSKNGLGDSLTRFGTSKINNKEILPWVRYDKIDHVNAHFQMHQPFRDFNDGDSFYKIGEENAYLLMGNPKVFAEYVPPEGAYVFFSSRENAEIFYKSRSRILSHFVTRDPELLEKLEKDGKGLQPEIVEIKSLYDELCKFSNFWMKFIINPLSGRDEVAIGPANPAIERKSDEKVFIKSVAGIWSIDKYNNIEFVEPRTYWEIGDNFYQPPGQELQLAPLKKTLSMHNEKSEYSGLTDTELDELIDSSFSKMSEEPELLEDCEFSNNLLLLLSWNKIDGERIGPLVFKDFLHLCQFLSFYAKNCDATVRENGASGYLVGAIAGSGDSEKEATIGERYEIGLKRIAKRVLKNGYSPQDSEDIACLSNMILASLKVKAIGYPIDFFYRTDGQERVDLFEELGIEEDEFTRFEQSHENLPLDPDGRKEVLSRFSAEKFEILEEKSKFFLCNALFEFVDKGKSPQIDYAGISMETVKAVENELGELLDYIISRAPEDYIGEIEKIESSLRPEELNFVRRLKGGTRPTLGQVGRIIRGAFKNNDNLVSELITDEVKKLSNCEFITSNSFMKKLVLGRIPNKFRNGGCHDEAVSYETCLECIDTIVGKPGEVGALEKFVEWKQGCKQQ